jgi:hypothetical protein
MAVVHHPVYSPGLALCDFFLFPRLKLKFKEKRFNDILEIQQILKEVLQERAKQGFKKCLQQWQNH